MRQQSAGEFTSEIAGSIGGKIASKRAHDLYGDYSAGRRGDRTQLPHRKTRLISSPTRFALRATNAIPRKVHSGTRKPQDPRLCGSCNARAEATGCASFRTWPPRSSRSTRAKTGASKRSGRCLKQRQSGCSPNRFYDGVDRFVALMARAGIQF